MCAWGIIIFHRFLIQSVDCCASDLFEYTVARLDQRLRRNPQMPLDTSDVLFISGTNDVSQMSTEKRGSASTSGTSSLNSPSSTNPLLLLKQEVPALYPRFRQCHGDCRRLGYRCHLPLYVKDPICFFLILRQQLARLTAEIDVEILTLMGVNRNSEGHNSWKRSGNGIGVTVSFGSVPFMLPLIETRNVSRPLVSVVTSERCFSSTCSTPASPTYAAHETSSFETLTRKPQVGRRETASDSCSFLLSSAPTSASVSVSPFPPSILVAVAMLDHIITAVVAAGEGTNTRKAYNSESWNIRAQPACPIASLISKSHVLLGDENKRGFDIDISNSRFYCRSEYRSIGSDIRNGSDGSNVGYGSEIGVQQESMMRRGVQNRILSSPQMASRRLPSPGSSPAAKPPTSTSKAPGLALLTLGFVGNLVHANAVGGCGDPGDDNYTEMERLAKSYSKLATVPTSNYHAKEGKDSNLHGDYRQHKLRKYIKWDCFDGHVWYEYWDNRMANLHFSDFGDKRVVNLRGVEEGGCTQSLTAYSLGILLESSSRGVVSLKLLFNRLKYCIAMVSWLFAVQ